MRSHQPAIILSLVPGGHVDPSAARARGQVANATKRALPLRLGEQAKSRRVKTTPEPVVVAQVHAPPSLGDLGCCPHECDISMLMGFCPRQQAAA